MDREVFLAGFDPNEDSAASGHDALNATLVTNLTGGNIHSIELMGLQCGKACYSISIAAAVTFLAGIYQVKYECILTPKCMYYLKVEI